MDCILYLCVALKQFISVQMYWISIFLIFSQYVWIWYNYKTQILLEKKCIHSDEQNN